MEPKPRRLSRIPSPHEGIQVNCCKNPHCTSFGVAAQESTSHGRKETGRDQYLLSGGKFSAVSLICKVCGTSSAVKNNLAIIEEYRRLKANGCDHISLACPNPECPPLAHPKFRLHGKTPSGRQRYLCQQCGTSFTPGARHRVQRRPELDEFISDSLSTKCRCGEFVKPPTFLPLRCIARFASLLTGQGSFPPGWNALYGIVA